jgi:hypothetical protein
MCAKIIEARVKQKKASLAEWNISTLVLLDGEQAFVVAADGSPINFKIGDGTKTFAQLPNWIAYDQAAYSKVTTNALPASDGAIHYSIVGEGTYTQATGGNVVIPTGSLGIISNNGTSWGIDDVVALPTADVSNKLDTGGYSGTAQDLDNEISNKADDINSDGKVVRTNDTEEVTETVTGGVIESVAGYYSYLTGNFSPISNWWSKKVDITLIDNIGELTIDTLLFGTSTAAAVYYDTNNNYLGYQERGTASNQTITDLPLIIPTGTRYIGLTRRSTTGATYTVLKNTYLSYSVDFAKSGGSTKTLQQVDDQTLGFASDISELQTNKADEINDQGTVLRAELVPEFSNVSGVQESSSGYYGRSTGNFTANSGYRSIKFNVTGIDLTNLFATSVVRGGAVALAVYMGASGYLGFEVPGTNDSTDTYTRYKLTPPTGTTEIRISRYGNVNVYGNLELRTFITPELAYSGGSDKTIQDLDNEISSITPTIPDLNVMVSGDSITAATTRWVQTFQDLAKPLSFYNNAIGSSRWSKSNGTGDFVGQTTQNYDDPNFAGISSGFLPTTDPVENQMRLNNCAVVHVQKFISEQSLGQHPVPDVIILAYGTNPDQDNGSASTAISGKTIGRDNTYTMANAMRWCLQELLTAFPNTKLFVSLPIQSGDVNKTNLLKNTKIPLMREVSQALSVPVIECFDQCGITEKFEIANGAGRYLGDGLHPNAAGGVVQGTYIYNRVIQFLVS